MAAYPLDKQTAGCNGGLYRKWTFHYKRVDLFFVRTVLLNLLNPLAMGLQQNQNLFHYPHAKLSLTNSSMYIILVFIC